MALAPANKMSKDNQVKGGSECALKGIRAITAIALWKQKSTQELDREVVDFNLKKKELSLHGSFSVVQQHTLPKYVFEYLKHSVKQCQRDWNYSWVTVS